MNFVLLLMICYSYCRADHIIFEQVGEMASSVTYLHVKMEIDLDEIHTLASAYDHLIDHIKTHSDKEKDKALDAIRKKYSNNTGSWSFQTDKGVILKHLENVHRICDDRKGMAKAIVQETNSLRHTLPNPVIPSHIWQTQAYDSRKKRDVKGMVKNVSHMAARAALSGASSTIADKAKSFIRGSQASSIAKTVIRPSRGLVALGLGALGTFMGLFNTYQIHNLEKELQQTRDAHNRLVEVVHRQDQHLQHLDQQMEILSASVTFIQNNDLTVLLMGLLNIEREIRLKLEKATHVTQVAQNRRLAVDFLPADQLPELFKKLETQAQAIDHKLIITQPSDLFQLELSYFYDGVRLQMLLHVPTVPKDSILRLLKLHPFPLPLNKNYSIIPMVQDDLLAISAGFNRYSAQLSSVDLLGCHLINKIYLCERHGVLGKQLNDSCLGVLYLQNFDLAQEICPLHIRPATEVVKQLRDNWFLIFSPSPQTAYVSCRNGTENEAYIKSGITRTFLSSGCKMNLRNHLLQADFSLSLPDDIVNFHWDWDISDLTLNLEDDMAELYELGNADPTLQDLLEIKKRNPKKLLLRVFITFICSIIALGLIAIIVFWYFAKDYILRLSCIQAILSQRVRNLIDTYSPPIQSTTVAPRNRRPATAPIYPLLERETPRELPKIPDKQSSNRSLYI
jgi:hypothetical protein